MQSARTSTSARPVQRVGVNGEQSKTERLIDLLKKLNATTYLSGPSADAYFDKDAFRRHGIGLEYKSYDYEPYPQLWGEYNGASYDTGPDRKLWAAVKDLIRSRAPDLAVVP